MVRLFVIRMRFIIFIVDPFLSELPIRVSFSSDIVKRWLPWFLFLEFQTLIDDAVSSKPILSGCNVHLIPILSQASSPYRSIFISVVVHSLGHGRIIIIVPRPLILLISLLLEVLLVAFKLLDEARIWVDVAFGFSAKEHR